MPSILTLLFSRPSNRKCPKCKNRIRFAYPSLFAPNIMAWCDYKLCRWKGNPSETRNSRDHRNEINVDKVDEFPGPATEQLEVTKIQTEKAEVGKQYLVKHPKEGLFVDYLRSANGWRHFGTAAISVAVRLDECQLWEINFTTVMKKE